jgi:DNA-binding CsgD family transcriptional regulator/tetratricopeptide (TPR) repeat protein
VALLEREHELGVLQTTIATAIAGEGCGVAVSGDSGTGKSTLLAAALASARSTRVLRGACDPLSTPRPLGPFRDVAPDLGLGRMHLDDGAPLAQLCEEIFDALRGEPTVLVVEDLHWVDAASAEVLRFLARRLDGVPVALLISYRPHETGTGHAARPLLGDFARLDGLATVELGPLSVAAVADLVSGTTLDAERVHELTGGNPFFVTEVAKDPERPLPVSVRDAVLARAADVSSEDFEVLQLVATAPDRLDDRVLPALDVDLPTLRRLDTTGLLTRTRGGLTFRHELARQAVESTIPPGGGASLHARLLAALETIDLPEPAVLTHHALAAHDAARTTYHAQAAAAEAIRAASHSEAAAFFQTALDHLPDDAPDTDRARLLQNLSFEQYMVSRLDEAIANIRATFPLWERLGDVAGLADAHQTCATYEYYNARRHEAEAQADAAATIAGDAGATLAYGAARAARGFMAYMCSDTDLALACVSEVDRTPGTVPGPLALKTDLVRDLSDLVRGNEDARGRVADVIDSARSHRWDELASTGYSQLANLDVEHRRLRSAEHVLEASLPFTVDRDIPICRHWQTGVRARLHFSQGRWSAAVEDAERVLDERGMPIARLWPHLVAALVPMRSGAPDGSPHLDQAWQLAGQIDEPLRVLPVLSALAERMWMSGAADTRVTDDAVRELERLTGAPGSEWAVGELASWLLRLGLVDKLPTPVADPFRLASEGRYDEAAGRWRALGEPFAEALTLGDAPDPALRVRGVELLDRLGAVGTADRRRVELRAEGVAQVPQRPRASTRANPSGLTNRQLDVAKLVARGFTNAEIATRLFISPKTADHHVSAVLTKLDLPNRRAVVLRADELGLA